MEMVVTTTKLFYFCVVYTCDFWKLAERMSTELFLTLKVMLVYSGIIFSKLFEGILIARTHPTTS